MRVPTPSASMSTYRRAGIPVVEVRGELDAGTGERLRSLLYDLIVTAPLVTVDLSGVPAADLRGLGALALVSHAAAKMDHEVRVAGCTPPVRTLADTSGAALVLRCYPDLPAALPASAA
jgi:anti-anti-sigma factor